MRALRKLPIDDLWKQYHSKCDGLETLKIHHLMDPTKYVLDKYGTIGFFCEDPVESIHAIVNILSRQYVSLESKRKATQVFRALSSRQNKNKKQKNERTDDKKKQSTKRRANQTGGRGRIFGSFVDFQACHFH